MKEHSNDHAKYGPCPRHSRFFAAKEATDILREHSTDLLFNHSTRVYLFATEQGRHRKLRFDPELLYVAAAFPVSEIASRRLTYRRVVVQDKDWASCGGTNLADNYAGLPCCRTLRVSAKPNYAAIIGQIARTW